MNSRLSCFAVEVVGGDNVVVDIVVVVSIFVSEIRKVLEAVFALVVIFIVVVFGIVVVVNLVVVVVVVGRLLLILVVNTISGVVSLKQTSEKRLKINSRL